MSDFKRHLPSDNGVHSMHVALNRIWDALEGKTGNASTTPVVNFIGGGSALSVSPSGGGTTSSGHNTLSGLQGGDTDNYWHLTSSEYTGTGTGTFVRANSPVFTGVPSAPTVILSDNSTSLATTAFVKGQGYLVAGISNASPLMNGPVAPGTSPNVSRYDHVHPSDTTKATSTLTSSYIFVGNASNVATGVAVTGDASLSNAGVLGVNKTRLNVRNETGTTLASTKAVYITGYNNFPLVALASNTDENKHNIIGVTIAPIIDQANGFIATSGQCDAETNSWVVGTELYASTSGTLVPAEPTSGEVKHVGIVTVQANYPNGKLLVYSQFEGAVRGVGSGAGILDRLGDDAGATAWSLRNYSNTEVAKATSLGAMTALSFTKTGGTSSQFLKADGTVDSTLYTALPTTTAVASATLTAGQWVNFHNVAGVKNARPADMTDATKPAQGFVLTGFASASTATVYLAGVNSVIPVGSYVAADVGKPAFLSTAGGTTLTPPASTGNYLQQIGWIDAVGATVTVGFSQSAGIVRA